MRDRRCMIKNLLLLFKVLTIPIDDLFDCIIREHFILFYNIDSKFARSNLTARACIVILMSTLRA